MLVAQCETSPDVKHAVDFTGQNVSPIGTPDVGNDSYDFSVEFHANVVVVHNKPAEGKQLQMSRHAVVQNDDCYRLSQN